MSVAEWIASGVVGAAAVWFWVWLVRLYIEAERGIRQRPALDAEYWPRRYAQIAAQQRYSDIPARLGEWQKERAT